jgi:hypothetical protein
MALTLKAVEQRLMEPGDEPYSGVPRVRKAAASPCSTC